MSEERDALLMVVAIREPLLNVVERRDPLQEIVELPPPGDILPRDPAVWLGEIGPE